MADTSKKDTALRGLNVSIMQYKGVFMWNTARPELFAKFKCRPSDVWICSFPRSGTTLVQEITYLVQTLDFEGALARPLDERIPVADVYGDDLPYYKGLLGLDTAPSPRMIKSHFHYFLLPEELQQGCGKIIYVYRDPKAVVVSLYRLLKYLRISMADTFDNFVEMFLENKVYGSPWAEHVLQVWEHRNDSNVLMLKYQDIVKDKESAVRSIATFLGRDLSSEDIRRIVDHTDIGQMRNNPMVNFAVQEKVWGTDKSNGAFINEGNATSWKGMMSSDHQHRLDKMVEEKFNHTDIKF